MGQLFWIRRPLPLSKTDIGYLFNPLLSHRSVLFNWAIQIRLFVQATRKVQGKYNHNHYNYKQQCIPRFPNSPSSYLSFPPLCSPPLPKTGGLQQQPQTGGGGGGHHHPTTTTTATDWAPTTETQWLPTTA
jgi:hypothetical protein